MNKLNGWVINNKSQDMVELSLEYTSDITSNTFPIEYLKNELITSLSREIQDYVTFDTAKNPITYNTTTRARVMVGNMSKNEVYC